MSDRFLIMFCRFRSRTMLTDSIARFSCRLCNLQASNLQLIPLADRLNSRHRLMLRKESLCKNFRA